MKIEFQIPDKPGLREEVLARVKLLCAHFEVDVHFDPYGEMEFASELIVAGVPMDHVFEDRTEILIAVKR